MTRIPVPLFDIGSTVYLRPAAEDAGQVSGYIVRQAANHVYINYLVTWEDAEEEEHSDFQLTLEKAYGTSGEDEE